MYCALHSFVRYRHYQNKSLTQTLLYPYSSLLKEDEVMATWNDWSGCSVTCDNGIETRYRECFITVVGATCNDTRVCHRTVCPGNGY